LDARAEAAEKQLEAPLAVGALLEVAHGAEDVLQPSARMVVDRGRGPLLQAHRGFHRVAAGIPKGSDSRGLGILVWHRTATRPGPCENPRHLMRKKLALSAVSILITLLFAEIAFRILGIGAIGRGSAWFAGGNHPRFLFQPDPSGYTLRPGFQGREIAQSKEFDVPIAIDGQGLRRQPPTAPPQPRGLAFGDSRPFGAGGPADCT